jgi:acyl carrier protein
VIGEYTGPMPDTYTTEFSAEADAEWENDDDECDGCHSRGDCDCKVNDATPAVVIEDDIVTPLTKIFRYMLNLRDDAIIDPTATIKSLNGDEMDEVEMVAEMEQAFLLNLGLEEAEKLERATFGEMVEFFRSKRVVAPAVAKTVSPEEKAYQDGILNGIRDLADGELAHYLAGDQEAADSVKHARYIDGYLVGYANGGND